MALKTVT